ncbi:16S rRNA pseudouridine(516) synthase [Gammaproteobacteria bacterium 54_18_T64]|nr:16S rRNA pseudouridine(516) synthase [Gammaproteobacteria bacterium 54_18_T64]
MRLDKFVCKSTKFSRTQAVEYIRAGKVVVNDVAVFVESVQVHENNSVTLKGQLLVPRAFRYVMIHKPANTICSNVDEAYPSLFSALNLERSDELHVAGRLDANTTGLVLATDDGRWSFDIIRPQQHCKKVYRVGLSKVIEKAQTIDFTSRFAAGLKLQGEAELTRPAQLNILGPREALLTISEGKFHQVKRMFASVGKRVVTLHREKIGEVTLDIEVGTWRYLTAAEVASFKDEA